MKNIENTTQPLTPEERLNIALSSGDNNSLVREAVNYVQSKICEQYTSELKVNPIFKSGSDDFDGGYFYPIAYTLVEKVGETTVPELTSWLKRPIIDKATGKPKVKTVQNYKKLLLAKLDDERFSYSRLIPLVDNPNLYRACQEVTNLTKGKIKTQI